MTAANPRTAKVFVRHASDCPDKNKGTQHRGCTCRKSLLVYDKNTKRNERVSADTRSWTQAEKFMHDYLEGFDPLIAENKRLRAEKETAEVPIVDAVALYIQDMIARLGNTSTVRMARSLLGHIDPVTKAVLQDGHLFAWIHKQVPQPVFVSELTPQAVTTFRSSWTFGDLSANQRWQMLKIFFHFCEAQGWVKTNPTSKLQPPKVRKGNRTAVFTDAEYQKILAAVKSYSISNIPEQNRRALQQRVLAFVELLRWAGMDLGDVIQYKPELVDKDGVLRYRRQKTSELGTVPLPEHLIVLLRGVPLETDSVGAELPFRTKGVNLAADSRKWQYRLRRLFELAGITEVKTEHGRIRKPHAKMFRDTCAVSALRNGVSLKGVARMLGHASVTTTERHYLPFVKELQDAHIEDAKKALVNAAPTKRGKVLSLVSKR